MWPTIRILRVCSIQYRKLSCLCKRMRQWTISCSHSATSWSSSVSTTWAITSGRWVFSLNRITSTWKFWGICSGICSVEIKTILFCSMPTNACHCGMQLFTKCPWRSYSGWILITQEYKWTFCNLFWIVNFVDRSILWRNSTSFARMLRREVSMWFRCQCRSGGLWRYRYRWYGCKRCLWRWWR